jgi:hypothetical protein
LLPQIARSFIQLNYDQIKIFRYQGYKKFLGEITNQAKYGDVWIVPISAGIEYMKDPKTNDQLKRGELPAFGCDSLPAPDCISPQNCK